jgi:hypothetical protein
MAEGLGSGRALSVLVLSFGADTGGQGVRLAAAFRRHAPDWHVRHSAVSTNYIAYPEDLPYRRGHLQRLYEQADVVHVRNTFSGLRPYERMAARRKPGHKPGLVITHHGTALRGPHAGTTLADWRANAAPLLAEARARGAVALTSTIDLECIAPDALTWSPSPYDLDWLRSFRQPNTDGRIVIGHAPTSRLVKSTHVFERAVARIRERRPNVDVDVIENVTWSQCLARKGRCDLFYDQMILGYGNNAIEAWGMGIPVVAGIADPDVRESMIDRWGELPFAEANETTLEDVLDDLVCDDDLRAFYGRLGASHVKRWHSERAVVPMLQAAYTRAVALQTEAVA